MINRTRSSHRIHIDKITILQTIFSDSIICQYNHGRIGEGVFSTLRAAILSYLL